MARPNYSYQKRQKELAKQAKREEKKQRRLEKKIAPSEDNPDQGPDVADTEQTTDEAPTS